ncbi:MAG: ATPase domain-containing protein [Candidatus Bathyarchaeia archaeon]
MTDKKKENEIEIITAKQLLEQEKTIKRIQTSTPIDQLIGGGIREDEVIELYGEFGAGKTQICFTTATYLAGELNKQVLFIDCEDTFRPERIAEIAQKRGYNPETTLTNIYVVKPENVKEQFQAIDNIPSNLKPAIIIVDGATTLFRAEYVGREELVKRQQKLRLFLHKLKTYAKENKTPIIITNQVYANPEGRPFQPLELMELAVGGHTLYHIINNRIFIRKGKASQRVARLVDSSEYPMQEIPFKITEKGVEPTETEG